VCGICGFVGPADPGALKRMQDSLVHRGPDQGGTYVDSRVSLAHRRLSIIDLDTGSQPMFNEDRSIAVVFNGEIYNHRDLRQSLLKAGHRFASDSDTECIIHAYEQFGIDCARELDGMFAFVIYDSNRGRLFGARDRMGKKPLYYRVSSQGPIPFSFSSEIKAFWYHPLLRPQRKISMKGLVSYLLNDYVVSPLTMFEDVFQLLPGTTFTFNLDHESKDPLQLSKYWEIGFSKSVDHGIDEADAGEKILDLLEKAIDRRLMSDVPLGLFLSGGIDSSAILALLRQLRPKDPIQTFSIGFDDPSFDESGYAERVAKYYGTRHHTRRFTAFDMLDRISGIVENLDQPFADPSILPVSMLCEFARDHITVALGGDGGDELFAGYDPFKALGMARVYDDWIPNWLHESACLPASRLLPANMSNMSLQFKVARFLRGVKAPPEFRLPTWMGAFSTEQLSSLIPDKDDITNRENSLAPAREAYSKLKACFSSDLQIASDFFQRFYLPDDILLKVDRASMMHSLEVRAPFLDTALVEYVNHLPDRLKYRSAKSKYVLRLALAGSKRFTRPFPDWILKRSKKGFGIPVARWIRHELKREFQEHLVDDWPAELDWIDVSYVQKMLHRHCAGNGNYYKELWALYLLSLWTKTY